MAGILIRGVARPLELDVSEADEFEDVLEDIVSRVLLLLERNCKPMIKFEKL